MERTIISWNVPNVITIWLMLAAGLALLAIGGNYLQAWMRPSNQQSSTSGGY
jgi:hypothetical protein